MLMAGGVLVVSSALVVGGMLATAGVLVVSSAPMVAASLVMAGVLKLMTVHFMQMFHKCLRLLVVEFNNCMPCHFFFCLVLLFHVLLHLVVEVELLDQSHSFFALPRKLAL
jgi:mannitol-specific phosphotransferase system IIBC component